MRSVDRAAGNRENRQEIAMKIAKSDPEWLESDLERLENRSGAVKIQPGQALEQKTLTFPAESIGLDGPAGANAVPSQSGRP